MEIYFLSYAPPKGNWKRPHVYMVEEEEDMALCKLPSAFFLKPIPSGQKIAGYRLTGKLNKKWDMIRPNSVVFPSQVLISIRLYDILMDHKLPAPTFGETSVWDYDGQNPTAYKLINIIQKEDLSIIDFAKSTVTVYNETTFTYEPISVLDGEEFKEKRGNLEAITLHKDVDLGLDLFILPRVSGWFISESLAEKIRAERITGLIGFPLSSFNKIDVRSVLNCPENYFAV